MSFFHKSAAKVSVISRSSELSSTSSSLLDHVNDVRIVTSKDYKAAAVCLANAFSKDEVAGYFLDCPDTAQWSDERRWKLHAEIMDAVTYAHVKFGVVHAIGNPTDGSYDAVALWMPPGIDMDSYLAMMRTGVLWKGLAAFLKLSKEGRTRMFKEFLPLLGTTKTEVLKERDPSSWYLVYLGTHSRARGRGLAKKLVTKITQQADEETRACYLESSNIINVPIYQKMGFEVCKQVTLLRATKKVSLDIMVREPIAVQPLSAPLLLVEQQAEAQPHNSTIQT